MADEMVEISAGDYAVLKSAHSLLDSLWKDKDHGTNFKRMLKAKMPDRSIPEIDVADAATAPIKAELLEKDEKIKTLADRLDKWEQSHKDRDDESALRKDIESARKKFSLTDEGVSKMIERMKEKNNPDVESAAAYIVSTQPKPAPTSTSNFMPASLNLYGAGTASEDANIQALHKDPIGWFDREVAAIMSEEAA